MCSPQDVARLASEGLSDREIGEALGVSRSTICRTRIAHGIPSGWTVNPRSHGTRSRYMDGCRCRPCRDAQRIYMRSYRISSYLRRSATR